MLTGILAAPKFIVHPIRSTLLGGEGIKGGVPKDPEKNNDSKQRVNVLRRKRVPSDGTTHHHRLCMAPKEVEKKWNRKDQQRIQRKSSRKVAVKQAVQTSRASAPGTSKACERAKRAHGEKPRSTRLEDKDIDGRKPKREPDHDHAQPPIDYLINNHETVKLTQELFG